MQFAVEDFSTFQIYLVMLGSYLVCVYLCVCVCVFFFFFLLVVDSC
jgi:hypothetical protein